MKAHISYISDWDGERNRDEEINTIEELIELCKKEKHSLIIETHSYENCFFIEVYDDYRE